MTEPQEAPDLQDQPDIEADAPSPEDQANAPETPEYFSDKFDPATLPDELRPAYQQLRGDYTRKTQEIGQRNRDQILQQALQDQNFRDQAFKAWGVEVPQEDEYEDDDSYDFQDPRVDAALRELEEIKAWRAEQQQVSQQQQISAHIDDEIESLEKSIGRELSDRESNLLGNLALQMPDGDGKPNVRAAYDELAEILGEQRKSWASSKRKARPAPSGQSGSKQVNLNNDQERLQALADAFEEAELQGE